MSRTIKHLLPGTFVTKLSLALVVLGSAVSAQALVSPIGLSIVPPIEMPPSEFGIVGVSIGVIYSDYRDVYGFDLGAIGNVTENGLGGIQLAGGFNYNKGTSTILGLQAAAITNVNVDKATIVGAQVALVNVNEAESTLVGAEFGLVNHSSYTTIVGAQLGLYNTARVVNGFQIGLINVADSLHGVQIGLANFNHTGLFSFAPILNIGF
jgi:hypothetical protein